jgi:hypothetical protein
LKGFSQRDFHAGPFFAEILPLPWAGRFAKPGYALANFELAENFSA